MTAVEIAGYGGPEVLRLCTRPVPRPAAGEVLVRVAAAGVNRPDGTQRRGRYPPPPGITDIPGLDIAGEVVAVEGASRFRPGDRVCALVAGGGYAEYCVAPEPQCMAIPEGLDLVEAASLPEVFFTAWNNVIDLAGLGRGETLLLQGGTSGVALAAMQMARVLRDARVLVTCGSAEKAGIARSYGAEAALIYRDGDWPEQVRALAPDGVDVILDSQGGAYTPLELGLLATGGRLVLIAAHLGEEAVVNVRDILRRRLTLTGSTIRQRDAAFKGAIARRLEAEIWPLFAAGTVRSFVRKILPLDQAVAAHRWMEGPAQAGKLVLTVGAP